MQGQLFIPILPLQAKSQESAPKIGERISQIAFATPIPGKFCSFFGDPLSCVLHFANDLCLLLQARLLYHEAATLDPAESTQNNRQRLDLLQEALDSGQTASDLCPASLSCAALRATMVTNALVCASLGSCPSLPSGQECEEMRQQFQGAYEACKKSLAAQPILNEPVICISTLTQKTCDPCCLVMDPSSFTSNCVMPRYFEVPSYDAPAQGAPAQEILTLTSVLCIPTAVV